MEYFCDYHGDHSMAVSCCPSGSLGVSVLHSEVFHRESHKVVIQTIRSALSMVTSILM